MEPKLNLVMIRVADPERSACFYRSIRMSLVKERHGTGPDHYSADLDGVIIELYPGRSTSEGAAQTRLGFSVEKLDEILAACQAAGGKLILTPKSSPWGRRAIVEDQMDTK